MTLYSQGIQSIQNSFVLPTNEPSTARRFSQILTPRRNLGQELSTLVQKSLTREQEEIEKPQEEAKVEEKMEKSEIKEENDSFSDLENCSEVDYWKKKAEELLKQVEDLEYKLQVQRFSQEQLEQKIKKFFVLQDKYQQDLEETQSALVNYEHDIAEKDKLINDMKLKIKNLEIEKDQVFTIVCNDGHVIEELTKKLADYEVALSNAKPKKHKNTQDKQNMHIVEKQMKILKNKYEHELQRKDQQLTLTLSALLHLQSVVLAIKNNKNNPIS